MTTSQDESVSESDVENQALAWVNRVLSGLMTEDEAKVLAAWRAHSAAHEQAFADAIRLQRKVRYAVKEGRGAASEPSDGPDASPQSDRRAGKTRGR
jgi:transmembrane sensor